MLVLHAGRLGVHSTDGPSKKIEGGRTQPEVEPGEPGHPPKGHRCHTAGGRFKGIWQISPKDPRFNEDLFL